jgi:acyl-[acyl-carrier-protein]-phospholipid O-acyltransferase/long-chain-fatty-acid--[acyl-carrier-protein] ligase
VNLTQFFGAFNDNLFKQLVLLICTDYALAGGAEYYQGIAMALFALPFVMFSGFAGYLADRISKQRIVVAMKVAEIAIMAAGLLAFQATTFRLAWLLLVLYLMATQSAFFGPSKYGILPELFRERDLPQVNGMIQMTTFLAIILGMAIGGFIKEWFPGRLWIGSVAAIGLAVVGTLTSLVIRRTPVAFPGLPFTPSSLFIARDTWRMIREDRSLFGVLMASSLFWFLGGVVHPSVNAFGKLQMDYGDGRTSILAICMAVGIMAGCLWAGKASQGRIRFDFVIRGAWGIVLCLVSLAAMGAFESASPAAATTQAAAAVEPAQPMPAAAGPEERTKESVVEMMTPLDRFEVVLRMVLMALGTSAGFFIVPLAVFLQVRPSEDQKGRMIGVMNLVNWIGILLAAGFQGGVQVACSRLGVPLSWTFAVSALILLPVALWYRPPAGADGEAQAA